MRFKVAFEMEVANSQVPVDFGGSSIRDGVDIPEIEAVIIRTLARNSQANGMQILTVAKIRVVEIIKGRAVRRPNDPARFAGGF
jgi:hypothetical protein